MTAGRTTAPITVRTQVYGGLGTGATHSQTLEAWFMHIPGHEGDRAVHTA